MLYFDLLPRVREGDGESGGEIDVHSLQLSLQEAIKPESESEDVTMTDQAPVGGQSQGQLSADTPDLEVTSVRTLRSASKWQEQHVKNRIPKIKDHEVRAGSVEDILASAGLPLQIYQNKLEDAQNKLATSKEDFKKTKAQLIGKKRDLAACRRKLKESKNIGSRMKNANSELRDDLTAFQEELSKCKDDLFNLQKVTQIPDSTITKRFESIGQQIVHWIDAEAAAFEKAHPEAEPDHFFSVGEDKYAMNILRLHPGAGEHLARYLIHRFLQKNVFGNKVYFFGLSGETAELLRKAELKMAELDPPRGI